MTKNTKPRWEVGDAFVVGSVRWAITALNNKTKAVHAKALSTTNHGMRWTTTLDKLPEKTA
ncbi:hypothetical protein J2X55_002282 [Microbacterium sp. 1154]|uniref:hypothetical protein n=1 Tax=Microbacterium sp. 1154 TaxID=2817733 RepID=UPI002865EEDD|nr:hypothetical protein [Microbacterium sp. 1154]MDR6691370.1 hypothetical protein [Microbacterium sp. 1154]